MGSARATPFFMDKTGPYPNRNPSDMKSSNAIFGCVCWWLRPALCISLYVTILSGCESKVEQFPKPQNGFDNKRIEYPKPPPLTTPVTPRTSDAVIIAVPKADYSKQPATPPTMVSTTPAAPSQMVCFEGELFIPPPVTANAMIIVECFQSRTMKTRNRVSGEPEDRVSRANAATGWGSRTSSLWA